MPCGIYNHLETKTPIYTQLSADKISKSKIGKKQSRETIEKRVAKLIGQKRNEETKKRLSEAHKGKKLSDETKRKISIARKGKPTWLSIHKEEFGKMMKGHPGYMLGKKHSIETKKKMSIFWKGRKRPQSSGEKHSNWKGGITPFCDKIRKSVEYKLWRKSVYERDNYTCQECGSKTIKGEQIIVLNAEHKIPFSIIIEKNKVDSYEKAISCQELWNVENGKTLCKSCHMMTQTYAGRIRKSEIKHMFR